jgi:hypothetical protein
MRYLLRSVRSKEISAVVVGSEAPAAVVIESSIFWDITPCSPLLPASSWYIAGKMFLQNVD